MTGFRFVHAADIHLDSPLRGLEADPSSPADLIRGASRQAVRNLVGLAIEERVAFVVIAGDLYDGDWQDWGTGLFLTGEAARLARAGIPLVMIAGNHDAASVITRRLRLPEGVTMLPAEHAGSVLLDGPGVAIHGRSFRRRAEPEDLTPTYPPALAGRFNIGLLHTSLTGRPGHDTYAPTGIAALAARDYDYWALGHVHAREEVAGGPCPIVYPGNLQGRHAREAGRKGASLVTVRDGKVDAIEHRPLDVMRWVTAIVDVAGAADRDEVMARAGRALGDAAADADGRPIAARVALTGRTALHGALLSRQEETRNGVIAEARQVGGDRVWIERVVIDTSPLAETLGPAGRPDAVGRLMEILDEIVGAPPEDLLGDYAPRMRGRLGSVDLPADHPLGPDAPLPRDVLVAARDLLLARLAEEA